MSDQPLLALYRSLPTLACKGLCADSCGPIAATALEAERMRTAAGFKPLTLDAETLTCGYLQAGRCAVYDVRPLICRLWGAADGMRCPHGCEPSRVVGRAEGRRLFQWAARLGGPMVTPVITEEEG
jgi:Fe-S-cluster containining protein